MNNFSSEGHSSPLFPRILSTEMMSRRSFIKATELGGLALILAACSTEAAGKPAPAADKSESQRWLRFDGRAIYNNTSGESFPLVEAYSKQHNIDVTYTNAVSDDGVYFNKVKSQLRLGNDIGADAVVLSDGMASRWIRKGYTQKIDHSKIPHLNTVRPKFMDVAFDPERAMSLPWRSGFTGIAWNVDELPGGLTSVSELWDPSLHGRVGVMSRMQDTIGAIMLDEGIDISSEWGDADFTHAVTVLKDQLAQGQVAAVKGNEYKSDLKSRKTIAAIARSGDILQINKEAGAHWAFAVPDNGGVLWTDHVVVPLGARHKANVEHFINYYFSPAHAVQVAAQTNFISPVTLDAVDSAMIDPAILSNELIFPTPQTLEEAKTFRILSPADESRYLVQFQSLLLGA